MHGIIFTLKQLGNLAEARKYAEMFPEQQPPNRDMMLERCTEGEERLAVRQKIVYGKVNELPDALRNIWAFQPQKTEYVRIAVELSESVINAFVPDEAYYKFFWHLHLLYLERAEISMADRDFDSAVRYLAVAKEYAQKRDAYNLNGKCRYSCTVFDRVEDDLTCQETPTDSVDYWKYAVSKKIFEPLRERGDYKKLMSLT